MTRETKFHFAWGLTCLLMVACAQLGLQTPATFNEKIAAGYGTITAALQSTTTLYEAGKISSADAKNIEAQCDNVKAGLDIARELKTAGSPAADSKLTATLTALQALQTYLADQQGSKSP